jgi:rhodanese-related sulfurtransferase
MNEEGRQAPPDDTPPPRYRSAEELKRMLGDGEELALLDVREEQPFSEGHLLFARSLPLSRLELRVAHLVPRRGTRIVLCDGGEGLAERAATALARFGYSDLSVLRGGVAGWAAAGFELFSGVNVPSKAFGEFVEHENHTPGISADELDALLKSQADVVVLDSRPFDEYARMSIPTAFNVPGAELVLRARALAPSPATQIVVNCAGRTRSIIGAQSLINAGVPNPVVALRNGTMGWSLAGRACESGRERRAPFPTGDSLAWAQAAAARVADRVGVGRIDLERLARLRAQAQERTLYLFDVRDPAEYEAGHLPGAVSAPGGQLVQATDQYVGTLNARIVLADDKAVRALMTASWLRQMGWREVFVLAAAGDESGWPPATVLGADTAPQRAIDAADLAQRLARGEVQVVDLSLSRDYLTAHIPGAWFAIRARLPRSLSQVPMRKGLVLTSEDGVLAGIAAAEVQALTDVPVYALAGGNRAWRTAGQLLTDADPHLADEPADLWLKPYERKGDTRDAMADYLAWETDLLPRIARDGDAKFVTFKP